MKEPIRVAITGAAGQIGYALCFRVASGQAFGEDQPVILHLLEIPQVLEKVHGVIMELDDCAFPLLAGVEAFDDPNAAFKDIDAAFLVGSRPRGPGMERADLLQANAQIFSVQGKALNDHAKSTVKVLVVGNPANTNALIACNHAPAIPDEQFHAMTRLDHNRAMAQVAQKLGTSINEVKNMTIWGNHSSTQFPDLFHCEVAGKNAFEAIGDQDWYENTFIPTVQKRGAAIIDARGASSAASAANGAIDHMRSWWLGTPDDSWTSMAFPSDGSYDIPKGIVYSYPVRVKDGKVEIVQGLEINDFARTKMDATAQELVEERDTVRELGMI